MKITNYEQVTNLYKANSKKNLDNKNLSKNVDKKEKTSNVPVDNVELSKEALFLQKVKRVIKETPDVREDKVRDIKERMQKGEYNITTEMLVEKLLSGK